jgi:hypothetical protein
VNYQDVVREFAERTQANLLAIEKLREEGAAVYETTQLVNSMLGLLVFPREEFVAQIPETPFAELLQDGWPAPRVGKGFPEVPNLRELIRYLRNAIAHFNIAFLADANQQIIGVRVWNTPPRSRKKTWEAELSMSDLRSIAERFTALILRDTGKARNARRASAV